MMKKWTFRQLWLYYLLFVGVALFVLPALLLLLMLIFTLTSAYFSGEDEEVMEPRSIAEIYQKAGLQGEVIAAYEPWVPGDIDRKAYTYEEGGLSYSFSIPKDKDPIEPTYDFRGMIDLYTHPYQSKRSVADHLLFREFFDQALYNGENLKAYQNDLTKALENLGLKDVQVQLETPYYYLDDQTRDLFNRELKKDLEAANKNDYVPVYGINTLDSVKYWSLSSSYMVISSNSSIEQFWEVKDKVDPKLWQMGYYKVEDRASEVYSRVHLDKQGVWTAVEDLKSSP